MSTPEFTNKGNSYVFSWQEEHLQAEVSRIRSHRDGRVTCRLIWTTTKNGASGHLWQKDGFNLAAGNNPINRKEMASRYTEKVDWTALLENVCVNSISEYERGEPILYLTPDEATIKPPYFIHPYLVDKFPTVFFGDPSSGKTTIALLLAMATMVPWTYNEINLNVPDHALKPLYLDWETGQEGIMWQWKCLLKGSDIRYLALPYRRCHASLADDFEQIRDMVYEMQADWLIIDSLALAAGGELKDTSAPLTFYKALGQLNVSALILAHTPKEKENRTIYGNRFFEAEARNIWEVVKQQEPGATDMSIGLKHRKPLPWDKLMPDQAFKIDFSEDGAGTVFSPADPKTIDEFLDRLSTERRILILLKDGTKRNPAKIAEELGLPAGQIRQVIYRIMHRPKPKLVKIGEYYAIAYQGELPGTND